MHILDLVYNFIDHPYHSANPALHVNLHILRETFPVLSEFGTTWYDLSPEQFHPFLWQELLVSTLHYILDGIRNMGAYVFGRDCLNFADIQGYHHPIRLRTSFIEMRQ